ncbi:MAG: hypothetical protein LBP58_00860 [Azoarcus sp.]|jgi:hypothetical protein|nr:hypothetical protein [Azoarcus sp.]
MQATVLRPVVLSPARIGEIAPCDFFDGNGSLLLRKGALISENLQKQLGNRHLLCDAAQATEVLADNPLQALADAGNTLLRLDAAVVAGKRFDAEACRALAESLHNAWQSDPDACIGFMRTGNPGSSSVCQAILAALFVAELGKAHSFTRDELVELIGAALTMNMGSMALHDEMATFVGPLPGSLRRRMRAHPLHAARILHGLGLPDAWSRAVAQHHENLNGSGYPRGLVKGGICLEARMLRLVDIFTARLRRRQGRGPRHWNITLARDLARLTEHVFGADLHVLDLSLARLLMGRLGLFPPGSIVRLSNGELAIVSRRSYDIVRDKILSPSEVLSFLDASGQPCEAPQPRRVGLNAYRILSYAHNDQPRLPPYDWPKIWGYDVQSP